MLTCGSMGATIPHCFAKPETALLQNREEFVKYPPFSGCFTRRVPYFRAMDHRRATGQSAEDICAARLARRGWRILARNWRIKAGELDLIALTGPVLVIVEVKALRLGSRFGPTVPVLAVGPNKQRRIRRLASVWIAGNGRRLAFREMRFDVVGITFDHDGNVVAYDHLENAF